MSAPIRRGSLPHLSTDTENLDRAWRMAVGDAAGNITLYKDGLLESPAPVLMAGLDYNTPWTRDTAINVWSGAGLLWPDVAANTLRSVLAASGDGRALPGGEYWDAIIWVQGAWSHYLYTGDRDFLKFALGVSRDTLSHYEATEFDAEMNLFRGAACYGDGISAYPDIYVTPGCQGMKRWSGRNPERRHPVGRGLPMMALSTNCLYYRAYVLAGQMARELGVPAEPSWAEKAERLRAAINRHFWMPEAGRYRYLVDPFGGCDLEEGLGHGFAVIFGVADAAQTASLLEKVHTTVWGIPCVWPSFARYRKDEHSFGRQSGTVWPHVQGFWAEAAARGGRADLLWAELGKLAELACRSGEFREIYHPVTGEPYGGEQEGERYDSYHRQTWSATAFMRMILFGVLGMEFAPGGVRLRPLLPKDHHRLTLSRLPYRDMTLDITVAGSGSRVVHCAINGVQASEPMVSAETRGTVSIDMTLE